MSRCGGACACRCRCCCCWRKARIRSRSCGVGMRSCCEPGSPAGRARSMAGAAVGGRGAATMVRATASPGCRWPPLPACYHAPPAVGAAFTPHKSPVPALEGSRCGCGARRGGALLAATTMRAGRALREARNTGVARQRAITQAAGRAAGTPRRFAAMHAHGAWCLMEVAQGGRYEVRRHSHLTVLSAEHA